MRAPNIFEIAPRKMNPGRSHFKLSILLVLLVLDGDILRANPGGGRVTQGSATFSNSGSQFTINQSTANAVINWQTFNIGLGETTTFIQPSANSVAWNQINDSNPSQILGSLNANGLIVLQNANGFYVGGQAAITSHGLIMTTASMPALDLSSGGPWSFNTPPPTAKIINYGQINVAGGGTAFLIASDIENAGTISAPGGKIGLYAGQTVLVSTAPDGRGLSAKVTLPAGSVDNEGRLIADAGSIIAQAKMVNQNGLVQANSVRDVNGSIELVASDAVSLGANSVISVRGDTLGISSGGSVIVKGGQSFSDQAGSAIDISGGAQGGNGGQVELSAPHMGTLYSLINGHTAANGFRGGSLSIDPLNIWLASANTDPNAPSDYTVININSYSGLSQISLQADNNISLNTTWTLADQSASASLSLSAGNNISLALNSGINAGRNWDVNLTAGTSFVPTASQLTPASGSDGIYLSGGTSLNSSYIHTQNGTINLWAANEVEVGWTGAATSAGRVNLGFGAITTTANGNINVTTLYGDVNTGSNPAGYLYTATAPFFQVDSLLGGISTASGGNVTIKAGRDVLSYLPNGNTTTAAQDGGTGAFGPQTGNVTITAGRNVFGHYVVANGAGTITAGGNIGAANGDPFALSLVNGGWNLNAPNGNIYLQEVRNPNGVFNNKTSRFGAQGQFLFNYGAQSYVDLDAEGVFLTGGLGSVPRPFGAVPVLYPPILDITAGAGGVTLDGTVALFPSPYQNLEITITDGGNLASGPNTTGTPYELLMSDSAQTRWLNASTFGDSDHGALQNEPNEDTPVVMNISGSIENLNLITTKITDITVGGDIINSGFSGQNLRSGDHTIITVGGQIFYISAYSFFTLDQAIAAIPTGDVPAGYANTWDSIFTLAVDPATIATYQIPPTVTAAQKLVNVLQNCSLFGVTSLNGILIGQNPGFVYDTKAKQLGFAGPMLGTTLAALTQPITILHLVNGQPVIDTNLSDHSPGRTYGQIETDTITWASAPAVQSLFADSQGRPSLNSQQLGLRIGGPGWFDIDAESISLGNSFGILSCGLSDAGKGFGRYGNLASITPVGATVDVTVAGDLNMLTSDIAALGGGDVNVVSTGGSMDLGATFLFATTASSGPIGAQFANGIFTTGGGNVNVTSLGDINIGGSRIATYNGGNIFVESLQGDVNVGNGTPQLNTVYVSYIDPVTGNATTYQEGVFGSGIVANTLVPPLAGQSLPPNAAEIPGNITVITPQGDITAGSSGITQVALNGSLTPGPSITLTAGSPGHTGNIDLGDSGVIGGSVNLNANGNITGQIVSRQNSTVTAAGNFGGTLLSGGSAAISGGGTISGTIIGVGGVSVAGAGGVTASVLGQNVSVNGGAAANTLGTATATAATQAAGAQTSQSATEQVASGLDTKQSDSDKDKKKPAARTIGRVTIVLPHEA